MSNTGGSLNTLKYIKSVQFWNLGKLYSAQSQEGWDPGEGREEEKSL